MKSITRRRFLAVAGTTIGASLLACGGLATFGLRVPNSLPPAKLNCGKEAKMEGKILVAYASKSGTTAEIAEAIGQALCEAGLPVDVMKARDVKSLAPYRAVVLGGAVRMARLLPDTTKFAKRHAKSLAALPTAYFSVSLTAADATEEAAKTLAGYHQPLRDIKAPIKEGAFAGAVIMNRLEPIMRWMLSKSNDGKLTECDHRDWDAIRAWASDLAVTLSKV